MSMKTIYLLSACVVLTALVSALVPAQIRPVQAQTAVVPGRSVGRIFLGMARADVWKVLGKPSDTESFVSSALPTTHRPGHYTLDLWIGRTSLYQVDVLCCHAVVVQVEVDSPQFATADGISAATPLTFLRMRFPKLKVAEYMGVRGSGRNAASVDYADDVQRGLAFSFSPYTDAGQIADLSKLKPDRVIVHLPSRDVLPSEAYIHTFELTSAGDPASSLRSIRAWFAAKPLKQPKGKN